MQRYFAKEKNINIFVKHKIFSREEVLSRTEIMEEEYSNGCLEISNGYIEKISEGRQTYYDLYNNHGELACMDGEIVLISSINKQRDTVTLINNNGEYPITFELYAEEIEEALFINVCDIK